MPDRDDLIRDLTELGRSVTTPGAAGMEQAVMTRLQRTEPASARPARRRIRTVAVGLAVVVALLFATPSVRAAVADWFGFGAVIVREGDPETSPSPAPSAPTGRPQSLDDAAARVAFTVYEIPGLGDPDRAWVSRDRRILTIDWDGRLRLDQSSSLSYRFRKTAPSFRRVTVDGHEGLWFEDSHDVLVIGPDGAEIPETLRAAGRTLVWTIGDTTLRLEGDLSLARALQLAETARRHR
jgi:hypothetical protein